MATPPVVRFPIFATVRAIGVLIIVLLLTWVIHFRGGLALFSDNKDLIFNVINLFLWIHLLFPFIFYVLLSIFSFFIGIENVRMRRFGIIGLVSVDFDFHCSFGFVANGYAVICLCILRKIENQSMSRFGLLLIKEPLIRDFYLFNSLSITLKKRCISVVVSIWDGQRHLW